MQSIDIDFDVFKKLTVMRESESDTYNDVLRRVLGLEAKRSAHVNEETSAQAPAWVTKGVRFPSGTEFRATHKGVPYFARVVDGAFQMADGSRHDSLSAAAISITGNSVNGWRFWECRVPGELKWVSTDAMRG